MRKKFVAGNWKMNMTPLEAKVLVSKLKNACDISNVDVAFCVPSIDIIPVKEMLIDTNIKLGAQNFYYEDKGAFTGEISADMLLDAGVKYIIIGHSERRNIFKEDDEMIHKKLVKAYEKNLIPILCCGESLECRECGNAIEFINSQLKSAFNGISAENAKKTIIAYEPIWAIGTGKTASSDQAEEMCKNIRETICSLYDDAVKNEIRILYGGSVNGNNAKELFAKANIDGGLIGGSSLKEDFINIVNNEK